MADVDSQKSNNAMDEDSGGGNAGLRRSKRNKFHLNLRDVLKSGTSSHRDYSPPTKKWATRRPEPATIGIEQIGKSSLSKRNSKKESAAINSAERPEVKQEILKPKEPVEKKQTTKEELAAIPIVEEEEKKIERGNESQEIIGKSKTNGQQIGANANHQPSISEFIRSSADIQLPEKILEEDDYLDISANKPQMAIIETNAAGPSSSLPVVLPPTIPATDEHLKRKRKVPLRHLDYTNGESDAEEEGIFRDIKMQYTSSDGGSKTIDVNGYSCPKCPAIFESRVGLTNHQKLHGSKKEFPCEICDFSCTNKKTMRQHRRVHGLNRNRKHRAKAKSSIENKSKCDGNETMNADLQQSCSSNFEESSNEARLKIKSEICQQEEEEIRINLDEANFLEKMSSEFKEDEMPVLEQQESTSSKKNEKMEIDGTNLRGFYKKGSRIYNRNTVKCPKCPFRTQSKVRLEPHLAGHERPNGFICSICQFKSESSGILRRHCKLHKNEPFKWPPDYLGSSGQLEASKEVEESLGANENDCEEKLEMAATGIGEAEILNGEGRKGEDCAPKLRSSIKSEEMGSSGLKRDKKFTKLIKIGSIKFPCLRCRLLFRNATKLAIHKQRFHGVKKAKKALISELLFERLNWRAKKDEKKFEETNGNGNSQEDGSFENSSEIRAVSQSSETSSNAKFHCRSCPYTTDQIIRLQKHENRHLVKAEHQCTHCTFSCRSMDILTQHMRLHENATTSDSNSNATNSISKPVLIQEESTSQNPSQQQKLPIEAPTKPVPIRRNETHYCPYCPYTSKHGCDIRAHYKMHEEKRKYTCSTCTYSTMRQNALIAHEKLHQTGNAANQGECRRLKLILQRSKNGGVNSRGKCAILGERLELLSNGSQFYRCAVKKCADEFLFCSDLFKHSRHHQKNEWTASKKLACFCGFSTNLERRMRAHEAMHIRNGNEEKNVRSLSGVFNCKECPYSTANYAKFWNHRQKHKRNNKFACPLCSFSAGALQCYNEHMELHNSVDGSTQIKPPIIRNEKAEENILVRLSSDELPTFKKETYEQINNAIPLAQIKNIGPLGKPSKEIDSGSSSSSNSSSTKMKCCTECPYKTNDYVLLKLHNEMHRRGRSRPFLCNLCSFGCFSAESLHIHLSLHASTANGNGEEPANSLAKQPNNNANSSYQCSQCNFKCVEMEAFLVHRKEHVQLLQQRLMTIIKRSANDNNNVGGGICGGGLKDKLKLMRTSKPNKQHYCSKCGFRCESVQAFVLHWEHHKSDKFRQGIFRCSICDYSSDTKNVVIFHEENHHLDVPLVALCQKKVS